MKWATPPMQIFLPIDAQSKVWPGDKVVFVLNRFGTMDLDTTAFDPTIAYDDGEQQRLPKNSATNKRRTDGDINIARRARLAMRTSRASTSLARFRISRTSRFSCLT